MFSEQKIRAILFYLSVCIFAAGLPFILSFTLGYKFDQRSFKFTKAGLIALKTQPAQAAVYLNNTLLNEKTPVTINELLPGTYNVRVELENYYPWVSKIQVEAGEVARLEKIILFPLRSNIKQINKDRFSSFWIDEGNKKVYYINQEDNLIYISDLDGENYEKIALYLAINPAAINFKLSADRKKLLYFNKHQIAVVYFTDRKEPLTSEAPFIINYPGGTVLEVFWHSDSYHIVIVTDKRIEVSEAKAEFSFVELTGLSKKNTSVSYDINTDTLYFVDSQKADDGNFYNNLYKLELNTRASPFKDLIKIKSNE